MPALSSITGFGKLRVPLREWSDATPLFQSTRYRAYLSAHNLRYRSPVRQTDPAANDTANRDDKLPAGPDYESIYQTV